MGEKWFQFVKRIHKETNSPSLKVAMRTASKRKSEWRRDDKGVEVPMNKTGKAKHHRGSRHHGTRKGKGRGTRGTRRR